jgi:hypothetical protein
VPSSHALKIYEAFVFAFTILFLTTNYFPTGTYTSPKFDYYFFSNTYSSGTSIFHIAEYQPLIFVSFY